MVNDRCGDEGYRIDENAPPQQILRESTSEGRLAPDALRILRSNVRGEKLCIRHET